MSNFWFAKLGHVVPNHLTGVDPESVVDGEEEKAQVRGRSMVVKKLNPLPIELRLLFHNRSLWIVLRLHRGNAGQDRQSNEQNGGFR